MSSRSRRTESDADRAIRQFQRSGAKFQRKLIEALEAGETGWHTLKIKIERRRLVSIQLLTDETITPKDEE